MAKIVRTDMPKTRKLFKPKMGYLWLVLGIHSCILGFLPVPLSNDSSLTWTFGITACLIALLTAGIYLRTFYIIDQEKGVLKIYLIFKVKTVELTEIQQAQITESPKSGFRYALNSNDGVLIKTGKWDEFFINPVDSKDFISELAIYLKVGNALANKK